MEHESSTTNDESVARGWIVVVAFRRGVRVLRTARVPPGVVTATVAIVLKVVPAVVGPLLERVVVSDTVLDVAPAVVPPSVVSGCGRIVEVVSRRRVRVLRTVRIVVPLLVVTGVVPAVVTRVVVGVVDGVGKGVGGIPSIP